MRTNKSRELIFINSLGRRAKAMNATVFPAYKHGISMMNRHYSLSLTDGPTNSMVLVMLVSGGVGQFFIYNPLTVSKETR